MHMFTSMGLSTARRLVMTLLSVVLPEAHDLTADPITAGQVRTVTFGLDGRSYEIELSASHAAALQQDLAPWVSHARRTGGSTAARRTLRPAAGTATGSSHPTMIRSWARANGHTVSDRGRLPAAVRQAYNAAH